MTVKLHRCGIGLKRVHACWRVEKALIDADVDYVVIVEPVLPRGRRRAVIEATGQRRLPAIEHEDGTWWREESRVMAAAIRSGRLGERVSAA